jgi:DNA-binding beta-propeller fold protein YncE
VDVFSGSVRKVDLPAPAGRLTVSASGQLVAATDPAGGTIALIDLGSGQVGTRITGLPPLRDAMFGDQDATLYIAAEGIDGIGVIDLGRAALSHEISPIAPTRAGMAALARTPDGRQILAQPQGGGPISVIDPKTHKAVGQLAAGPGTAGMFPSGIGHYLLVPDNVQATLAVFRSADPAHPTVLPGAAGVTGIYTTWLDSVAFMPSAARRSVLLYDLDKLRLADEIALPGTPARGAVTVDSGALYLPILDPPQVLVLDGATRRVTHTFDLASTPLAALIAGGSGLCH